MLKCNSAVSKLTKCCSGSKSILILPYKSRYFRSSVAPPFALDQPTDELWENARPYKSIPGPSLWDLIKLFRPGSGSFNNTHLSEIQKEFRNRYGNLVRMPGVLGKKDVLFVYEPDDMAKVYRTEGLYPIRHGVESLAYYRENVRTELYTKTNGLATEQGEKWWDFRQKVNGIMMSPKATKRYIPQIDEIAKDFVQKVHSLRSSDNRVPDNFVALLNMWSLESICHLTMDIRIGLFEHNSNPVALELMTKLKLFFDYTYQLDILPSIWKIYHTSMFKAHMKNTDDIMNCALHFLEKGKIQLQERKRNNLDSGNEAGILEKLLKIDEDVALLMTLDAISAGVDATSSSSFFVFYSLALNPDKQKILREELKAVLPNKDSKLIAENMANMPYLRACIKESFRMYPLNSGNLRTTGQDITLQGYQIPKETNLIMAQQILLTSDVHYEQSSKFIPERFLRESSPAAAGCPKAKDANPFIFLPFGFGPRMCVGKRLAELEMHCLISRVVRNYKISWIGPPPKVQSQFTRIPVGTTNFILEEVED